MMSPYENEKGRLAQSGRAGRGWLDLLDALGFEVDDLGAGRDGVDGGDVQVGIGADLLGEGLRLEVDGIAAEGEGAAFDLELPGGVGGVEDSAGHSDLVDGGRGVGGLLHESLLVTTWVEPARRFARMRG